MVAHYQEKRLVYRFDMERKSVKEDWEVVKVDQV